VVAAFVRTIFAQPDGDAARRQIREVATRLGRSFPKAAGVLADAEDDMSAYEIFRRHHWRKTWSTNSLERVAKETKRRIKVVGVFPNDDAVLRLVGAILAEQHDERQISDRCYLTMNSTIALELGHTFTLEAAQHKARRRGLHMNHTAWRDATNHLHAIRSVIHKHLHPQNVRFTQGARRDLVPQ